MNSPFLPIFNNPSHVVAGASELDGTGIKTTKGDQSEGSIPFAEVLGDSQQAQEQNADTLEASIREETHLDVLVFSKQDIIDEAVEPGLKQVELLDAIVAPIVPQGSVNVTNLVGTVTHPVGTSNPLPHGVEHLGGNESLPIGKHGTLILGQNIFHPSVQNHGQTSLSIEQDVTQGRIGQTDPRSHSFPTIDQAGRQGETIRQAVFSLTHHADEVSDSGLRSRPLLQEHTQPNLNVRAPVNLVSSVVDGLGTNVQQQGSIQNIVATTLNSDTGSLGVNPLLSQQREDLSQLFTRTDGEARTSASLGITPGSDGALGMTGSGLSFGHHTGNGQGPILDSSTGTLVSANHGQVATKGGSFDDRLQLLNVPVQQRLQIDVQVSEAARVQVDVGVQQRQVYAGVLLDNPVLRALATQNVQELESQLAQAEMELEEFDVHEGNQLLNDQHGRENSQQGKSPVEFAEDSISSVPSQEYEGVFQSIGYDAGWHLVA